MQTMAIWRRLRRTPRLESTGNPLDDRVLAVLANKARMSERRHWIQLLNCPDETTAHTAAASIEAGGWQLQQVARATDGDHWLVIAERYDVVITPADVTAARVFFETVAAGIAGAQYDGWEVNL
jgi:Regulator of ribonuclease activity B